MHGLQRLHDPGRLSTGTPGSFTYTVTATSTDGQSTTASVQYTVARATPSLSEAVLDAATGVAWSNTERPGARAIPTATLGGLTAGSRQPGT